MKSQRYNVEASRPRHFTGNRDESSNYNRTESINMASTRVETYNASSLHSMMELSDTASLPPPYAQDPVELRSLVSATSSRSSTSLPEYDDVIAVAGPSSGDTGFHATASMQIENRGLPVVALPLPPRPYPIPVYAVDADGRIGEKVYESVRQSRGSGNAILFRDGNPQFPVCSTTYRFGPGRPPRICLLGPDTDVSSLGTYDETPAGVEAFDVLCKGYVTRAVSIRTDMGTFEWRHASRAERRHVGADSLLVMEQVTPIALAGGRKKEEVRRRVAQFVRNSEVRTQGTGRSTAGNGGRLMMDLRAWVDGKDDLQRMEAFVVASCIVMLKREMDRRRVQQAMVISGGGGGGGP